MGSTNMVEARAPSYVVDAAKSRFQVRVTASGMLSAFGHNPVIAIRNFTGEAWVRAETPDRSSLRLEIDATSLAVTSQASDKDRKEIEHLMREEVLETARYPEIKFESSGIQASTISEGMYGIKILGKLTLHGVERDVLIPCNVTVSEDSLRAYGDFSVRQTDYGIRLVSVAGGVLKVKDELKFTFDIVADRRREAGNG